MSWEQLGALLLVLVSSALFVIGHEPIACGLLAGWIIGKDIL